MYIENLDTDVLKASFGKREDAQGKVWIRVLAHDDLTADTPYKVIVNEYGFVTAAFADETAYCHVGVPDEDIDSGDVFWAQIGGRCSAMITPSISGTVGYALKIFDGAVADASADYSGAGGEFCVVRTASTTSTTQDVILIPERIITTT